MKLTEEQIKFLDDVCRGNWKLNSKGKVDVKGSVNMNSMDLTEIPVKFGRVEGWVDCAGNKLTTLKNCPDYVREDINFSNNKLTTLEYCPDYIGEDMNFSNNNITTLEYFPKTINGELHCTMDNNPLHNYFKSIKEEDFLHWEYLDWSYCFINYPYLINILKKYMYGKGYLNMVLENYPLTKIYYKN